MGGLLNEASILSNTLAELSSIKQLIEVSSDQLDLSGIISCRKKCDADRFFADT